MNKVYLSFRIVKDEEMIDVIFDEKMSFTDNFKLLKKVKDIGLDNINIYDPYNHIFLKTDIPIKHFNLENNMYFEVY